MITAVERLGEKHAGAVPTQRDRPRYPDQAPQRVSVPGRRTNVVSGVVWCSYHDQQLCYRLNYNVNQPKTEGETSFTSSTQSWGMGSTSSITQETGTDPYLRSVNRLVRNLLVSAAPLLRVVSSNLDYSYFHVLARERRSTPRPSWQVLTRNPFFRPNTMLLMNIIKTLQEQAWVPENASTKLGPAYPPSGRSLHRGEFFANLHTHQLPLRHCFG